MRITQILNGMSNILLMSSTARDLLSVFVVAFLTVALCFAGIGIKILLRKHGEFKRRCSGYDPYSGEGNGCLCAGKQGGTCEERTRHPYQPLEVNSEILKEIKQ